METEAMWATQVMHGAQSVLEVLETRKLPKAVLTRNNQRPVDHLLELDLQNFKIAFVTRDWDGPAKPSPAPLLHIARVWDVPPVNLVMVGDSLDDLLTARGAGAVSVFLHNDHNEKYRETVLRQGLADIVLESLSELVRWLEEGFFVERD
ncbi:hypothetical protein HDU93_000136 [Gonapodya sp. JEL0774]|nr:hypothetical protein HDU93_000136 [Gonapodya sp. JEL0774]